MPPLLADVTTASQETTSKVIIVTKTRSTITRPQTSAAMTFSVTAFSMEINNQYLP
jgi:hypothetical protein